MIGSGMGGMTIATALSRFAHKVLLLEQAPAIGGLTHSFSRNGFTWDVGLHYCGTFGPGQTARKILDWLSGGTIDFRSVGTVYDTLHFPNDFTIPVERPEAAYKMEFKEQFPHKANEIESLVLSNLGYDASLWCDVDDPIPAMFVSFPSLTDAAHETVLFFRLQPLVFGFPTGLSRETRNSSFAQNNVDLDQLLSHYVYLILGTLYNGGEI